MSKALAWWNRLTPVEREQLAAYYDRTAREAYAYCCSILIGCPHLPTADTRSATGVFVNINDNHYVLTANHVVEGLWRKLEEQGPAHFQIGQLVINPAERTVHVDEDRDLILLAIDPAEVLAVGCRAYVPVSAWPPSLPTEGQLVQLAGFAACNRQNGERGTISSYSLHLVARVLNPRDCMFYAQIERDGVPTENVGLLPPPGESLGGISGGPVTLFSKGPLPLIGIISEMIHLLDAVRVSALCEVHVPARRKILLPLRSPC